ncbi:uncharacterized protein [Setaria viridis]|uniref:uncharacterized protein n=1 Tax=Setaria viridis TaxID=4556 RepID=UPI001493AA8C|nr:uncharacterized protein LOC117844027 [Setaria viridis]
MLCGVLLGASVPPELLARIRTITLDLVEGLPECAVSTAGVPPEKVELKKVFGRSPFAGIVAENWLVLPVAGEHRVINAAFDEHQMLIAASRRAGVEVPKAGGDGSFRGEDVAAAVRRVMVEEEGQELARNAMELT